MKLTLSALLLAFSLYFISCKPQQVLPEYLEKVYDSSGKGDVKVPELRIQKNDHLSIQIYSASTRQDIDAFYNPLGGSVTTTGQATQGTGYLVDAKGNIEYPRLGRFHAEGLTKEELADVIKKRLTNDTLLTDPTVIIRFLNLKVTVLGEVASQGEISIPGERLTILEAMGLAGGITDFGLKNKIKVVRETDGKREMGYIDLSSDSLFLSPYYNLVQNDVVMVMPTKKKAKKTEQDLVIQRVSFGLSIITAIALVYNIFQ